MNILIKSRWLIEVNDNLIPPISFFDFKIYNEKQDLYIDIMAYEIEGHPITFNILKEIKTLKLSYLDGAGNKVQNENYDVYNPSIKKHGSYKSDEVIKTKIKFNIV